MEGNGPSGGDTVSDFRRLVVVGSSAGGIDALSELAATLPSDFPAPIVIAQHLSPRRPSHLAEILKPRSALDVITVEKEEKLVPGKIYVVPADRDVHITDGHVRVPLRPDGAHPKPSVDRLFASAAESYGEGLIAVVLTGSGSDGAEGARKVKLAGGTVVIQDPASARYPSMPASLAPTTVDVTARLERIAGVLVDLLAAVEQPEGEEEQLVSRFLAQIRDRTGVDFNSYKRPTIMRRLRRRIAAVHAGTIREYIRYANQTPQEYDRLAASFLIKVTEFFRDTDLFDRLRTEVLPRLIRHADDHDRELRIWSAGCATGEEAYSLGILVAEVLGEDITRFNVRVFATDVDNDAVNFARRGIYSASSVEKLPPEMIDKYFTRLGDEFEIRKQIRAITVFGQHNLAQRAPFPRIDLAVSRNVLIYFTPELQRRALQLFAFSLRDNGYLVLGKAESVTPLGDYFVLEDPRLKIYRREGGRVVIPAARGLSAADLTPPPTRAPIFRQRAGIGAPFREQRPTITERAEQALLRLPVGVVVLASRYEIVMINVAARDLLGIHGTAIGDDFIHASKDIPSHTLRDAIDRARAGDTTSFTHELSSSTTGAESRAVRLTFRRHHVEAEADNPDAVLVVVEDVTWPVAQTRGLEAQLGQANDELAGIRRQMLSIETTNQDLVRANQELTLANAELRSANEDLLVGSEEVQAATEEVETLNEELQATNEELETLNEELQATVEELNTTNDDLEARGRELELSVGSLEERGRASDIERDRLKKLLLDGDHGWLVADSEGNVLMRNERWRQFADAGRFRTADAAADQAEMTLDAIASDAMQRVQAGDSLQMRLVPAEDGHKNHYELRTEPLRDDEGRIRGVSVTIGPPTAARRGRR